MSRQRVIGDQLYIINIVSLYSYARDQKGIHDVGEVLSSGTDEIVIIERVTYDTERIDHRAMHAV